MSEVVNERDESGCAQLEGIAPDDAIVVDYDESWCAAASKALHGE